MHDDNVFVGMNEDITYTDDDFDMGTDIDEDISEYELDESFMNECYQACLGTMVQMMMETTNSAYTEAVINATNRIENYLVGQGIITEAAGVPKITNKKVNVVHLSKDAQIKRLTTIITLKMARKNNHKAYRKYKLGQKIKKENRAIMDNIYGAKAARLAKKMYMKLQKSSKPVAVVAEEKNAAAAKTEAAKKK